MLSNIMDSAPYVAQLSQSQINKRTFTSFLPGPLLAPAMLGGVPTSPGAAAYFISRDFSSTRFSEPHVGAPAVLSSMSFDAAFSRCLSCSRIARRGSLDPGHLSIDAPLPTPTAVYPPRSPCSTCGELGMRAPGPPHF